VDLQLAFRARLKANSTLSELAGTRMDWGGVPQGSALPYIRLTKVAPGRDWTHDGPNPLVNPRVQLEFYGATAKQAADLAAAAQAEMERLDEVTVEGWTFLPPGQIEIEQGPEPDDLPGGITVYRLMHDYSFFAQPAE
jgi:hypothetical protein